MTTNDHETGKVSEPKECPFCSGPAKTFQYNGTTQATCAGLYKDCAGTDVVAPVDMWNRRAESQTGAVRDESIIAKAYLRGIEWGRANGSTPQEAHKAAYDYADKTLSALEPTPIKETQFGGGNG